MDVQGHCRDGLRSRLARNRAEAFSLPFLQQLRCATRTLVPGETASSSWASGAWRQWMKRIFRCLTRVARLRKSTAVMARCFLGHALTGGPGTDPSDFRMALLSELALFRSASSGLGRWTTHTSPSPTAMDRPCKSSALMLGRALQSPCHFLSSFWEVSQKAFKV